MIRLTFYRILLILILGSFESASTSSLMAQGLAGRDVINKSIEYHDPQKKLMKSSCQWFLEESRPGDKIRKTTLLFEPRKDHFELHREEGDKSYRMIWQNGEASFSLNGIKGLSKDILKENRLTIDRLLMLRNYYHYLWYLPMKLEDDGTLIHDKTKLTTFFGKEACEVRVTYEAEVGEDTWYFYFNPSNYAMIGYRFYHNEQDNDGEYILLNEEQWSQGIRIPKIRNWYTHRENRFLGEDRLVSLTCN